MVLKPRNETDLDIEQQPIEYWWDPGNSSSGSIEEEEGQSEYDCGYLDLGAETPSTSASNFQGGTPYLPRQRSFRRRSSPANKPNRLGKYAVDRDCGICFEYAVRPCRTLCCGKVFCTEHLADWLHGPEAEGRCPNCENACSLAGGTLSLTSLIHGRLKNLTQTIDSSPSTLVKPHSTDTLTSSQDRLHLQVASTSPSTSSSPTCSCSSTVDCSDTTICSEESKIMEKQNHVHHSFPHEEDLTNSFSVPWGIASRLVSIMIFLMFLYKLRSWEQVCTLFYSFLSSLLHRNNIVS